MEKKLPKVFANKIDKVLDNNRNVFYSNKDENLESGSSEKHDEGMRSFGSDGQNINQKINSIFSSTRYVYKADVDIVTRNGKISKRVIGKNGTHLITIDNELIPITDIMDIDFSE